MLTKKVQTTQNLPVLADIKLTSTFAGLTAVAVALACGAAQQRGVQTLHERAGARGVELALRLGDDGYCSSDLLRAGV